MKPKSLVTIALLTFIAVSVIALIAKEFGDSATAAESGTDSAISTVEDRVVVYYFHGNVRCVTCRNLEAYTQEAIETGFPDELDNGNVAFQVINYETPNTEHYIQDYQIYAPSVVLVRFEKNVQVDWENLSEVWELAHNKDTFMAYIQDETTAMIQDGS